MDTISLVEAVRLSITISAQENEIARLEDSNLWKWYTIGYAIAAGSFTRAKFIKESEADKTSVSMAVAVAVAADSSVKFRRALESGEFGSLRKAYDARKKFGSKVAVTKPTSTVADKAARMVAADKKAAVALAKAILAAAAKK